jgi:hypothetical protein
MPTSDDRRDLDVVEREVYPSVRELERERQIPTPPPPTKEETHE